MRPLYHLAAAALILTAAAVAGCSSPASTGGDPAPSGTASTDTTSGTDATDATGGTDNTGGTDTTDTTGGTGATDVTDTTASTDSTDATDSTDGTGGGGCEGARACEGNADCAACAANDDPCTGPWTCAAGTCAKGEAVGEGCGENHPCVPALTPGSQDPSVTACVCALDAYCCQVEWDDQCAGKAASDCGEVCSCDVLPAAALACTTDEQCEFCDDDFSKCNGTWTCLGGVCTAKAEVVCDTSGDVGCVTSSCDGSTGECVATPDDSACDDGEYCTKDTCNEVNGQCGSTAIEGCGMNHPCKKAETPGSNDPVVTACVCEADAYCCSGQWDGMCVTAATDQCGVTCGCDELKPADLACKENADCLFCDDDGDLCNGGWSCADGTCAPSGAVTCPPGPDGGCLVSQCQPGTGECVVEPSQKQCLDGDVCTKDACGEEDGKCTNEAIPDCDPAALSCAEKCTTFEPGNTCQCDDQCFQFADCCEDICTVCAVEFPGECG